MTFMRFSTQHPIKSLNLCCNCQFRFSSVIASSRNGRSTARRGAAHVKEEYAHIEWQATSITICTSRTDSSTPTRSLRGRNIDLEVCRKRGYQLRPCRRTKSEAVSLLGAGMKELSLSRVGIDARRSMHSTSSSKQLEPQRSNDSALQPIYSGLTAEQQRITPARDQLAMWQTVYGVRNVEVSEDVDSNPDFVTEYTMRPKIDDDVHSEERSDDQYEHSGMADEWGTIEQEMAEVIYLQTGDLVEVVYPGNKRRTLCVVVREVDRDIQLYTMAGKSLFRRLTNPQFAIPGFVSPELITRILPYLPETEPDPAEREEAVALGLDVPREVAAPIITKLKEFWNESQEIRRTHAKNLDNAHKLLAHRTDLRFGTLERLSRRLLAKDATAELTDVELYTVHTVLGSSGYAFGSDTHHHRANSVFVIRPITKVETVHEVQSWIRKFQEWMAREGISPAEILARLPREDEKEISIIHDFIKKARRLIDENRQTRQPTFPGWISPSKTKYAISQDQDAVKIEIKARFTRDEGKIIEFLEDGCLNMKFRLHPELQSLAITFARFVDMTPKKDSLEIGDLFAFLQEIGVLSPWENRETYGENLLLPIARHSRPLMQLASSVQQASKSADDLEDRMKDLRKDWKDWPVYCIDDKGAKEIDDGISLESIPGNEDEHWVHVHIANPTAFLDKSHPLSKMAAHLTESLYFPETTWSMLPPSITQKYFSLDKGRPTLTFSVKLNSKGEVIDKKIQNGSIANVIYVTPHKLEHVLGLSAEDRKRLSLQVGEIPERARPQSRDTELSQQQINELKTLERLAQARVALRNEAGGQSLILDQPDISVYSRATGPGLPFALPSRHFARFFYGDPAIRLDAYYADSRFLQSEQRSCLVREMMLLCCEVSALWARERSLPLVYRGTIQNPNIEDRADFLRNTIQPLVEANKRIPILYQRKLIRLGGVSVVASEPIRHTYIGVAQYTKSTSPLRRFGDMIAHWQIESALREEARVGKSLADPQAKPIPPEEDTREWLAFSRHEIDGISNRLMTRERLITRSKHNTFEHWAAQLFLRAFHYGETKLPDELTIKLEGQGQGRDWIVGTIMEYGIKGQMKRPAMHGFGWDGQFGSGDPPEGQGNSLSKKVIMEGGFGWRIGDTWKVKIDCINPYLRAIFVQPLRLEDREIPIG